MNLQLQIYDYKFIYNPKFTIDYYYKFVIGNLQLQIYNLQSYSWKFTIKNLQSQIYN